MNVKQKEKIGLQRIRLAIQLVMGTLFAAGIIEMGGVFGIILIAATILAGPLFCGWICPLGLIQEITAKIGKIIRRKLKKPDLKMPGWTKYIRYIILLTAAVLMLTGIIDRNEDFFGGNIIIVIVSVAAFASLFIERFFCRFICPFGAMMGLSNLIKIKPVRITAECKGCGMCAKACPVGIDIRKKGSNRDLRCISCMKCVDSCRVEGAVKL